jgi:tetratricopeptide (TPR) repeat protein
MASPFQKYQSGIEASTGNLVSAYGQMAQQTSAAITGLGQNLAEGIKAYAKNRDENELLTSKAQGLAGNFEFLTKQIKDNPELAPFAESFNPILSKIGKFETMSKAQKQALLLEAETFQAQIAPALAIFKEGNVSRTRQGVQSALEAKPKIKDKFGVTIEALPFQPDKDTEWNIQNNREYFELTKKNDPKLATFDVESALQQTADGWSSAFAADPNLAKTDPKYRDTILKGLADWKATFGTGENVDPFSDAYTGATLSPVEARMREVDAEKQAGKPAPAVVSDTTKAPALLTGRQKYETAINDAKSLIEKDKADLDETFSFGYGKKSGLSVSETHAKRVELEKSIEKRQKELDAIKPESYSDDKDTRPVEQILAERKVKEIKPKTAEDAAVAEFAKSVVKNTQKTLEDTIRTGGSITVGDIARDINTYEIAKNPTVKETYQTYGASGGYGVVKAPSRYTEIGNNLTAAAQKLGIPMDKPMTADQMYQLNKELGKQSTLAETKAGQTAKTLEELKPSTVGVGKTATPEPSLRETMSRPFDFNTKIKSDVPFEREMTYAEEKQYVRKWFMENRGGVIPESLDAIYKSVRPETDVQFIDAPAGLGGKVMITAKGAQYIPPDKTEKGLTDKQKSEKTLYNYGTPDASGTRIIPEERTKGSGIKLAGFAKGGEENAKAFQKLHDDTVKARTIIPKLLAMYKKDKLGRTLIPDESWGDAESLLAQLKAAIRVETVGTGPVALPEHQMILERIGDPRTFFARDVVGKSKLNSIMSSMENSLRNNNAGISVTFSPTAGDAKAMEQQARIEANKSKR